jgi:hypothetical protein
VCVCWWGQWWCGVAQAAAFRCVQPSRPALPTIETQRAIVKDATTTGRGRSSKPPVCLDGRFPPTSVRPVSQVFSLCKKVKDKTSVVKAYACVDMTLFDMYVYQSLACMCPGRSAQGAQAPLLHCLPLAPRTFTSLQVPDEPSVEDQHPGSYAFLARINDSAKSTIVFSHPRLRTLSSKAVNVTVSQTEVWRPPPWLHCVCACAGVASAA